MSDGAFTPALGRPALTSAYDTAIRLLTRERRWRSLLLQQLRPQPGERILDVGCGTGTFAIMAKTAEPRASVVGLDPDERVLDIARAKAARAGVDVEFCKASPATPGPSDHSTRPWPAWSFIRFRCPRRRPD